jgi:hypothetical protein
MKRAIAICICMLSITAVAKDSRWFSNDVDVLYSSIAKNKEVKAVVWKKMSAIALDKTLTASESVRLNKMAFDMYQKLDEAEQKNQSLAHILMMAGYAEKADMPVVRMKIFGMCKVGLRMLEPDFVLHPKMIEKMKEESPALTTEIDLYKDQYARMLDIGKTKCLSFDKNE